MFDLGHPISRGACRDKIQILYVDHDLSHLLPLDKNINEFS